MPKMPNLMRNDTEGSVFAAWCPMLGTFDIRALNSHCEELARLAQRKSRPLLIEDHDIDALAYAGTRFNL